MQEEVFTTRNAETPKQITKLTGRNEMLQNWNLLSCCSSLLYRMCTEQTSSEETTTQEQEQEPLQQEENNYILKFALLSRSSGKYLMMLKNGSVFASGLPVQGRLDSSSLWYLHMAERCVQIRERAEP